jgi:hypothetical protein
VGGGRRNLETSGTGRPWPPGWGGGGLAKNKHIYRGADKSLARRTSRCILFDGENIPFDASLFIYI